MLSVLLCNIICFPVIAFAGDALICVFTDLEKPVSLSTPSPSILPPKPIKGSNSVRNCCFRAMQCAAILKNHEASSTMTTMSLSTHIGLSYGDMKMAFLGKCARLFYVKLRDLHSRWIE